MISFVTNEFFQSDFQINKYSFVQQCIMTGGTLKIEAMDIIS